MVTDLRAVVHSLGILCQWALTCAGPVSEGGVSGNRPKGFVDTVLQEMWHYVASATENARNRHARHRASSMLNNVCLVGELEMVRQLFPQSAGRGTRWHWRPKCSFQNTWMDLWKSLGLGRALGLFKSFFPYHRAEESRCCNKPVRLKPPVSVMGWVSPACPSDRRCPLMKLLCSICDCQARVNYPQFRTHAEAVPISLKCDVSHPTPWDREGSTQRKLKGFCSVTQLD